MEPNQIGSMSSAYGDSFTMGHLLEAVEKLKRIPNNDQWLVVTPEGGVYKGTVESMLPMLLKRHPLCQPPKFPMAYNPGA